MVDVADLLDFLSYQFCQFLEPVSGFLLEASIIDSSLQILVGPGIDALDVVRVFFVNPYDFHPRTAWLYSDRTDDVRWV